MPKLVLNFTYGLTDPRLSGVAAIRYVGITVNPNERYRMHLSCPVFDPAEKNAWVQDVLASGLEPGIEIFETFVTQGIKSEQAKAKRKERETYWIHHYIKLGAVLLNGQNARVSLVDELRAIYGSEYAESEYAELVRDLSDVTDDPVSLVRCLRGDWAFGDF